MKQTITELIDTLAAQDTSIETQLLAPKLIRKLYAELGAPTPADFPDECATAGTYWTKQNGYTTHIDVLKSAFMVNDNLSPTDWYIKRASGTKVAIVDRYTRAGWHCRVQAYNVLAHKYVQHPRYPRVWVLFYSTRDCNKYEYVIEAQ